MKWFKHDTDASIDAKLQELLLDYGASGYGLYWYCVELIAQNVNENNITFELEHDARIIARNLNLTTQETKDMMKKMIDLELFSIAKNDRLACYSLAKRLDQSMTSNTKFRKLISDIKEQNHDEVMTESIENHDKVMQEEKRREEKRREENIKDIVKNGGTILAETKNLVAYTNCPKPFTFSLSRQSLLSSTSKDYQSKLEEYINNSGKPMSYEDFYTQCEMKPYKYKNFKMAYDTWNKNAQSRQPMQSFKQQDTQTRDAKIDFAIKNDIYDIIDAMEESQNTEPQGVICE